MTNRETIIKRIVELERQGAPLGVSAIEVSDPELLSMASDAFGTWEIALQYAGVSLRRADLHWGPEALRVIELLRSLADAGENMRSGYNLKHRHALFLEVRRCFDSWSAALEAAGVDNPHGYRRKGNRHRWNRPKIIEHIRTRHETGLTLDPKVVKQTDSSLFDAALATFASWGMAVKLAGLGDHYVRQGRVWSEAKIVSRIRERMAQGLGCRDTDLREDDSKLLNAGRHYFGTWQAALDAAIEMASSNDETDPANDIS